MPTARQRAGSAEHPPGQRLQVTALLSLFFSIFFVIIVFVVVFFLVVGDFVSELLQPCAIPLSGVVLCRREKQKQKV